MEAAPLGWLYDITYAVLARRLKKLLNPDSPVYQILSKNLVNTAINFRALNPNYANTPIRSPALVGDHGAGSGAYASAVWTQNQNQVMPATSPLPTTDAAYAVGQDPQGEANKGLLIAKLFWDLQNHLPCVLFNVVSKTYVPVGVGGSAVSKRFFHEGKVVTELAYKATLTVEATVVAGDEPAAASLQAIVEAAFGPLRDHVDFGAAISGRLWQLMLPVRLTPSNLNETDAPWAQGDDKGSKLYTTTIGLEDIMFECISYVGRPLSLMTTSDPEGAQAAGGDTPGIRLPNETGSPTEPMMLKLGVPSRLIVTGAPMQSEITVNQKKRVIEIRRPYQGSGLYEVVPKRTGEATIFLFDTGMSVSTQTSEATTARTGAPLVQRKVVVTAV